MTAQRPEPPHPAPVGYRCLDCKIEVDESADSHDEDCSTGAGEHCFHAVRTNANEDWDFDDDWCVHCDCCCTCLGCEYGPRDGMPMNPGGLAEVADVDA